MKLIPTTQPGATETRGANAASTHSSETKYAYEHGDTLARIARRHGVSLPALQAANPHVLNPDVVYPDQQIHIPSGSENTAASEALAQTTTAQDLPLQRHGHDMVHGSQQTGQIINALATASAPGFPVTRYGDKGPNVTSIQYLLRAHGLSTGVDGRFGPQTVASVKKFQSTHGLAADGVAGPLTLAKLTVPAQYGHSNPNTVRAIQVELNKHGARIALDGSFGNATRDAVRAFQAKHSLPADGAVGPQTWKALFQPASGSSGGGYTYKPYTVYSNGYGPITDASQLRKHHDYQHRTYGNQTLEVRDVNLAHPGQSRFGQPVPSPITGKVEKVGYNSSGGHWLQLRSDKGELVFLLHFNSRPSVKAGQRVQYGQIVGQQGSTGNSTGPHVHIEAKSTIISRWVNDLLDGRFDGRNT